MKRFIQFFILIILIAFSSQIFGTHNRAGEIIYEVVGSGNLTYKATIITYTKTGPPSDDADRDTLTLNWGDGTTELVFRSNGPIVGGFHQGEQIVPNPNGIKKNVYESLPHTYPGPLPFYVISMEDPNRIDGITNINGGGSVNIPFYLEDTIRIYDQAFTGVNNSPVLLYPPIDYACINEVFVHNPAAFEPDGDSLHFELIVPWQGTDQVVPNYEYPDEVSPGVNNNFTINSSTGEIIWDTPREAGIYNIAILVTEYRNGLKMGTILRDMQIIVSNSCNNSPPVITNIRDTCIVAGNDLAINVIANDPDGNQTVTLEAVGGPLNLTVNQATFSSNAGNPATGFFNWQTACSEVRRQPYQVVFRAEDSGRPQLVDLETWVIKVVAPAPENVLAEALGNEVRVSWDDPYFDCDDPVDVPDFIGFSVWRREGPNNFSIDTCVTGLGGRGYIKIADRLEDYFYVDTDLTRGKNYCYRVLGEFAKISPAGLIYNQVSSLPSNESCSELSRDIPLIKEVSVTETSTSTGKMAISWYKPKADTANLDTTQLQGPYKFRLLRSTGFTGANLFPIDSSTSPTFSGLNDTTFQDGQLNTVENPYSYAVEFYARNDFLVGTSDVASSVFLSIDTGDRKLCLDWRFNVPWQNDEYVVFRYNNDIAAYDTLVVTEDSTYCDAPLVNDSVYCYLVQSVGSYSADGLDDTLVNLSQEVCATPMDTIAPCPPIVEVTNNCKDRSTDLICYPRENVVDGSLIIFENIIRWTNPTDEGCYDDIVKYMVYARSSTEDDFTLIADSIPPNVTEYSPHTFNDGDLAGCYRVVAVDTNGLQSDFIEPTCIDNCPCYALPNVFTPNGDGKNDEYTPFQDPQTGEFLFRFIDKVEMKIFNRWGALVFETEDPEIHWDGTDVNSGKELKEGVYYYVCSVYEKRQEGSVKNNNVLSGYIHLIRSK